ncbi:hypothetical protein [Aureliella helgolandensis]|nr:hypothetical protein [Aureliella helgolandensis]
MTSYSDSAGSKPADEATPNWDWLTERVKSAPLETLENWLDAELEELECQYADFVTAKSRMHEMRSSRAQ